MNEEHISENPIRSPPMIPSKRLLIVLVRTPKQGPKNKNTKILHGYEGASIGQKVVIGLAVCENEVQQHILKPLYSF